MFQQKDREREGGREGGALGYYQLAFLLQANNNEQCEHNHIRLCLVNSVVGKGRVCVNILGYKTSLLNQNECLFKACLQAVRVGHEAGCTCVVKSGAGLKLKNMHRHTLVRCDFGQTCLFSGVLIKCSDESTVVWGA